MVELIVLNYLKEKFDMPVMLEAPEVPSEDFPIEPEQYIIIEKTGDYTENQLNKAQLAIQSYGNSLYTAMSLDEKMKQAMADIVELAEIYSCKLSASYNHTDTRKKKYRYQSVFAIVY